MFFMPLMMALMFFARPLVLQMLLFQFIECVVAQCALKAVFLAVAAGEGREMGIVHATAGVCRISVCCVAVLVARGGRL
jgi:hypothetical protein